MLMVINYCDKDCHNNKLGIKKVPICSSPKDRFFLEWCSKCNVSTMPNILNNV